MSNRFQPEKVRLAALSVSLIMLAGCGSDDLPQLSEAIPAGTCRCRVGLCRPWRHAALDTQYHAGCWNDLPPARR
jgi:hypothetical protein